MSETACLADRISTVYQFDLVNERVPCYSRKLLRYPVFEEGPSAKILQSNLRGWTFDPELSKSVQAISLI